MFSLRNLRGPPRKIRRLKTPSSWWLRHQSEIAKHVLWNWVSSSLSLRAKQKHTPKIANTTLLVDLGKKNKWIPSKVFWASTFKMAIHLCFWVGKWEVFFYWNGFPMYEILRNFPWNWPWRVFWQGPGLICFMVWWQAACWFLETWPPFREETKNPLLFQDIPKYIRFQVIWAKHAIIFPQFRSLDKIKINKLNKYHLHNKPESKISPSLTVTQSFGNPNESTLRYVRTGIPHSKPPYQPTKQDIAELVCLFASSPIEQIFAHIKMEKVIVPKFRVKIQKKKTFEPDYCTQNYSIYYFSMNPQNHQNLSQKSRQESSWAFWPSTSFQAMSTFLTSCIPPYWGTLP